MPMRSSDQPFEHENKSHKQLYPELQTALCDIKARLSSSKKISPQELAIMDRILDDLSSFLLGQHILLTGGANGIWTDYLISPNYYLSEKNHEELTMSVIERFFLFSSPAVLAQRELHQLLQKFAQDFVKSDMTLASIPCGLMRDLLSLDYSNLNNISLFGIDIDNSSLEKSQELALKMNAPHVNYLRENAWNLKLNNSFDFISSIGLNVYEKNIENVVELYRSFYNALKPGGLLFTGILTWPPYLDTAKSDWVTTLIPKYDLYLETILHKDILDIQWFNFRTLDEIENDFRKAGFKKIRVIKDSKCIFPAVIAFK